MAPEVIDPYTTNFLDIKLTRGGDVVGYVQFFVDAPHNLTGSVVDIDIEHVALREDVERAIFANEGLVSVVGGWVPPDISDDWAGVLQALDHVRKSYPGLEWEAPDVWSALRDEDEVEGRVH